LQKNKNQNRDMKRLTEATKTSADSSERQKSDRLTGRFAAIAASEIVFKKISVIEMPLRQQAAGTL
jgi:hypothetical protein